VEGGCRAHIEGKTVSVGFVVDAIMDPTALVSYLVLVLVSGRKGLWEEAVDGEDPELCLKLCEGWNSAC